MSIAVPSSHSTQSLERRYLVKTSAMPAILLLLGLMSLTAPACYQAAVTYPPMNTTTVLKLQQYIEGTINSTGVRNIDGTIKLPMIPAFVRLAFHDCNSPAGCDGCLNLGIAENNGLAPAVNNLEQLYTNSSLKINTTLSRADFWALAGLTAAYYGARLQKVGGYTCCVMDGHVNGG